jgi:hypothetical protein
MVNGCEGVARGMQTVGATMLAIAAAACTDTRDL